MEKYEIAQDPCFSELLELQRKKQAIEQTIHQKGKEFYEKEKKEIKERIIEKKKALTDAVSKAEEALAANDLCKAGVHVCCSTQIKTSNGFIAVNICPFCGKIISATEFILLWENHHSGSHYKRIEILESEYAQLQIEEECTCEYALKRLNKYLEVKSAYEGTDWEFAIGTFFGDSYLFKYYEKFDFGNVEIKSLLQSLIKAVEAKEQAHKDLSAFDEEKETQQLMEELCKTFGHDIVDSGYDYEYVECKYCGRGGTYGSFVKAWEEAPLHDIVIKRPIVKPNSKIEIKRGPNYKSPDDYNYYDD